MAENVRVSESPCVFSLFSLEAEEGVSRVCRMKAGDEFLISDLERECFCAYV